MSRDEEVRTAVAGANVSSRGWARGNCPFCATRTGKEDRKRCLGLNQSSGVWHCFRCGAAGKLSGFTAAEVPLPGEASAARDGIELFDPPESYEPLFEGPVALVNEPAKTYLLARGLVPEHLREAQVGACSAGRFRGRVIVPILDPSIDRWLGWSARAWFAGAERKYLYPPGMSRGRVIYNHAALYRETDDPVIVVEGVLDALALWPDAVAVLGSLSGDQREALSAARRPVAFVLDGDAWLHGAAEAELLRFAGHRAGSVRLPPESDPDEWDPEWVRQAAKRSLTQRTF